MYIASESGAQRRDDDEVKCHIVSAKHEYTTFS